MKKLIKKLYCIIKRLFKPNCNEEQLIFKSGFNNDVRIKYLGNSLTSDVRLTGKDETISGGFDWKRDVFWNCNLGRTKIQFIGGDQFQRTIDIVDNPDKNYKNKALLYTVHEPWKDKNNNGFSRIQLAFYDTPRGLNELYIKKRMYLSDSFNIMRTMPIDIHAWGPCIFELFNDEGWTDSPYKFRINVRIKRDYSKSDPINPMKNQLVFTTYGQVRENNRYHTIWEADCLDFNILTNRWIEIEYYLKNGNRDTGKFIMTAKYDGDSEKHTIFDVSDSVHHPNDPDPYGLKHWQPLKMYSSTKLTDYFKSKGRSMQIYWDHIELWKNKKITP